ncbi:Rha family transcriptional regulator [Gordoniibacillus kamchatkensis]|uniref:Rha family transcriptional regulator n=1 Tax=Gordoniibacillus kamchatkensis TaxID=1590651 RepID=A0ABR5AB49_9BACL|nr:helix-turn-helix transcriptional regulator [Paenibacillus sp. VKM B-2647]KIL38248.1 Rha family transcriptional regulator [Paenibacillus sp. VKM B-2647]
MKIVAKSEVFARTRIVSGMSQRELARQAGISHSYISLLERSMKSVGPATAKRISDVLQRPVEDLFDIR